MGINGTISQTSGPDATVFPYPMVNVAVDPLHADVYGAVDLFYPYTTVNGGTNWMQAAPVFGPSSSPMQLETIAVDPRNANNTIWVGSKSTRYNDGTVILTAAGHLFRCANARATLATARCATWAPMHNGMPNAPVNVVKLDPGDPDTVYVGTEIGLYRSIDGGANFVRFGTGLPLVSVTDIAISADGSSVRLATFGRGFWEIHPDPTAPSGVAGNGDFDGNQIIDGYDVVREACILLADPSSPDYNPIGNLVGSTNQIDAADLTALLGKLGGRP